MKHTNRLWAVKALARAGFECLGERVPRRRRLAAIGLSALGVLSACSTLGGASQPQLAPATGASLASCTDLAGKLSFPGTTFSAVEPVAAGALVGTSAHCRLTGQMNRRVSPVDGKTYAIGFEMRLPLAWNGRFFHQVNGGIDGVVAPAVGGTGGGGPLTDALQRGFAVISSDAGHDRAQNPTFGIDPQARLDYGYNAVGALTPMAKSVIAAAYGKGPDRSYIAGCSNGGRHAMVAAARYADQYDGILAGDPGFTCRRPRWPSCTAPSSTRASRARRLRPSLESRPVFPTSRARSRRPNSSCSPTAWSHAVTRSMAWPTASSTT